MLSPMLLVVSHCALLGRKHDANQCGSQMKKYHLWQKFLTVNVKNARLFTLICLSSVFKRITTIVSMGQN